MWKISAPPQFNARSIQPVSSCYTDYAIWAPFHIKDTSNYRIERELSAGVFVLYDVPKDRNHSLEVLNSLSVKSVQDLKTVRQEMGAFVLQWVLDDLV